MTGTHLHTYTPTHTHMTLDAKMIHQMLFDQNFNVPWKPIHVNTEPNLITNHGRFYAGRHMFLYKCPALTGLIPFGYVPDLGLFGSRWQLNKFCKTSQHISTPSRTARAELNNQKVSDLEAHRSTYRMAQIWYDREPLSLDIGNLEVHGHSVVEIFQF